MSLKELQDLKASVAAGDFPLTQTDLSSEPVNTFKTSLYTITGAMARAAELVQDIVDNTELDDARRTELLNNAMMSLELNQEALPEKLDGCVKFIRSLERQQEAIKAEEAALKDRRDRLAKQATVTAARRGIAALKPH